MATFLEKLTPIVAIFVSLAMFVLAIVAFIVAIIIPPPFFGPDDVIALATVIGTLLLLGGSIVWAMRTGERIEIPVVSWIFPHRRLPRGKEVKKGKGKKK